MNNSLSKTLFIPAVACLLGACMKSTGLDMEVGDDSLATRSVGPATARTAIGDADDVQTSRSSSSVWGSYTAVTGGTATNAFDAEKVTCLSGMWGYEGTRCWLPGNTYDFYTLYPPAETPGDAVSSVARMDGAFTANGLDATKGYNLITAKKTSISAVAGRTPGAVALKFQHLLVHPIFVARSEGDNVTVRSISLEGLTVEGDRDDDAEIVWDNTTTGKASAKKETNVTPAGNANVSDNLLFISQSLADGAKLTVIYDTDAETEKPAFYILPVTTVSIWEAANHYRYPLILTGGDYIVLDPPTTNAWSDAIDGNIIIDAI